MILKIFVLLLLVTNSAWAMIGIDGLPIPVHVQPSSIVHPTGITLQPSPQNSGLSVEEKETILSITCLVCCRLNRTEIRACQDEKICQSQKCTRFVEKLKIRPRFRQPVQTSGRRRGRVLQPEVPKLNSLQTLAPAISDDDICRQKHPQVSDIRFMPRLDLSKDGGCKFFCTSMEHLIWNAYVKDNGLSCADNKVCWEGQCTDRGSSIDDAICKNQLKSKSAVALVSLPCQLVCQDIGDNAIWIYSKTYSPLCHEPSWMPRREYNF